MAETVHEGDFYATGFYVFDADGDPVINTGELALSLENTRLTVKENANLIEVNAQGGLVLRRFRLVDEGPVLDMLDNA